MKYHIRRACPDEAPSCARPYVSADTDTTLNGGPAYISHDLALNHHLQGPTSFLYKLVIQYKFLFNYF